MTASHVHVIGAGLAGLSAAVALSQAGRTVTVLEAGPAAGGRCRSYFDRELGLRIDNGNHLLLSGNRAAFAYIDAIGARETLAMPDEPVFPFMDLGNGLTWTLRPEPWPHPVVGPLPRAPRAGHAPGRLPRPAPVPAPERDATVAASLRHDTLYHRLVEPLAIAALNTPPDVGLARTAGRGHARDAVARRQRLHSGLSARGSVREPDRSSRRLAPGAGQRRAVRAGGSPALRVADGRLNALHTTDGPMPVEAVVLAVPPWVAADLLPGHSGARRVPGDPEHPLPR